MLVRDHRDDRRAVKSAAGSSRVDARSSNAGERTFAPPTVDQECLTIISLFIIMVLTALNVMLRFPELGTVIASYNQF